MIWKFLYFFLAISLSLIASCKKQGSTTEMHQENAQKASVSIQNEREQTSEASECAEEKKQDLLLAQFSDGEIRFIETKDCPQSDTKELGLTRLARLWDNIKESVGTRSKTDISNTGIKPQRLEPVKPHPRSTEIRSKPGSTERFRFQDNEGAPSSISSSLDKNGHLTFTVASMPGAKFRGQELFEKMMDHHGAEVKGIEALWEGGSNHEKYLSQIAAGVKPKDAAMNTWTGKQARSFGFNNVKIIKTEGDAVRFLFY